MKIDGACHCGYITIEGEADPEKQPRPYPPLAKAPRAPVPRNGPGPRYAAKIPRTPGPPQNPPPKGAIPPAGPSPRCGSPTYSTSPGEGTQPSYMVRVGILRQRDQFIPETAELVPLGAAVGDGARRAPQEREAGLNALQAARTARARRGSRPGPSYCCRRIRRSERTGSRLASPASCRARRSPS